MNPLIQFKTTILPLLIALVLACFGLSPKAQATDLGSVVAGDNTADGSGVLISLTSGVDNSGFGFQALNNDSSGNSNTANGFKALFSNTNGEDNTATGLQALYSNKTGVDNTANGFQALFSNTTVNGVSGDNNTANGFQALFSNTTGNNNTANGFDALFNNATISGVSGDNNTANGWKALFSNTTGSANTAIGSEALANATGSHNIALGSEAGVNLTSGSNNIDIGAPGTAFESATIRIGTVGTHTKAFIAGVSVSAITGTAVVVNSKGRLGVASSSARFKDEIKPMNKASEAILALRPVTFRYKKEIDPDSVPQFGLVAEEVEKVNPDLVARDRDGKPFTVRYEAVNAMLLNEFLKEHRKVEELEASFAKRQQDFQSRFAQQQKQIEALTAGLQKVSAQREVNKGAPQTVANNQ